MRHQGAKLGWGPIAAAGLLVASIVVPVVWGDVYPFTSAPMFRDNPRVCCNYRVFGPGGEELPAAHWLCQRVYDGNPLGYGVGIRPPAVIEQQFGQIHAEEHLRRHVQQLLNRPEYAALDYLRIEQDIIGPLPAAPERVGVVETRTLTVGRH
jgi:hypothetical protein